jgi:LAGLIDADG endonuclease
LLSINLAICWKLRVSRTTKRDVRPGVYASDNVPGADNQQERLDGYIAGYVDGEGSFSVSIQRNPSCRLEFQLVPEFHVSQNGDRAQVLELIQRRLACGYIKRNSRRDRALVFVVRKRADLLDHVIPFFEACPLLSSKEAEFESFALIVRRMALGHHRNIAGFSRAPRACALDEREWPVSANAMERARSPFRILRDCTPDRALAGLEDTVRAAWRHAESGRNDLAPE